MARGSIVKRNGVYQIRYRIGKKQKAKTIGPNKKEAERILEQTVSEINNGSFNEVRDITFREFIEKWLNDYAKTNVKDSTFDNYSNTIKVHLIPVFGDYFLRHITQEEIQRVIARIAKERSPKTVNNVLVLLKTMFKTARQWHYLRENPALDVKKLREPHKEMDFLRPDEIQLLLKHAHGRDKIIITTAVLTGMRMGELFALKWGDVDWHNNLIYVRRSLYWRKRCANVDEDKLWKFTTPKSKKSFRTVVLSPKLRETLEIFRIEAAINRYDLIFANQHGEPVNPDNFRKKNFEPLLRMAGLRHIRFHDLRHTYCSLLISQNENLKFIQSQMGHASIETTFNVYGHLMPGNHSDVGKKLDGQIFSLESRCKITQVF